MSKNTFLIYKIITAAVLGVLVSLSIDHNNWYLPVIGVVSAFAFLSFLKRKVKGVMADERDYRIAGKASYFSITAYSIISVVLGIILVVVGKEDAVFYVIGNTLLYSACFIVFLYAVLFKVFLRKDEQN